MDQSSGGAVWTLRQIAQARALRARLHVDDEVLYEHGVTAEAAARNELLKVLRHLAESYAMDLDDRDVELLTSREPESPWTTTVTARWHPDTNACELRRGPYDGRVIAHQRPGEPLRLPVLESLPTLVADDATRAETALSTRVVTYLLAGWSERHRRWVYEADRG